MERASSSSVLEFLDDTSGTYGRELLKRGGILYEKEFDKEIAARRLTSCSGH